MAKERTIDLWMSLIRIISDVVTIYLTFCFAFWIRFHMGFFGVYKGIPPFKVYQEVFPVAVLIMILVFKSRGLYVRKVLGSGIKSSEIIKAVTWGLFVLMSVTFIYREATYSRLLLVVAWLLCIASVFIERRIIEKIEKWIYRKMGLRKKVIILGSGEVQEKIVRDIRRTTGMLYEVVGILVQDDQKKTKEDTQQKIPTLGKIEQLPKILSHHKIDEVILTAPNLPQKQMVDIILNCEKEMVRFRMVPDIIEILTSQVIVENFCGVTLLGLKQFPLERALNRFWKRTMDVIGASAGLILTSLIFLIIAILIKKDTSGRIFYFQKRVGEDGRRFTIIKFRTMIEDAERKTGPVWAKESDPRRTKIGKFLRKLNLDELPQLWNVLKGEMSLVGPRPERPHFVNEFKDKVPRYMSRHKIKSGMTGWAQVNGLRGNTSILERIKYDLYYLENWSLMFDLKIILMTFLTRKNAY